MFALKLIPLWAAGTSPTMRNMLGETTVLSLTGLAATGPMTSPPTPNETGPGLAKPQSFTPRENRELLVTLKGSGLPFSSGPPRVLFAFVSQALFGFAAGQ